MVGLLIHGDAAFSGLGIVAECLQLARVPGALRLQTYVTICTQRYPYFGSETLHLST